MHPKESQFPISHVKKLHNIGEEHFKYEGDNEGKVKGGSYEVIDRGDNDKYEARARFELPGSKTQHNWGTMAAGTTGYSDPAEMQDTFETPNAARQAAVNNASSEHVKNIKSGAFVKEPQATRKGGTIKIDSNPVKGK
jgi:hypothetical protein